jgi:excisionase family DNA binding protein
MGTELLTAGQVAARAGVHRTTVWHWEKDGKLRAAQVVNGMRLFRATEVDRWIAERDAAEGEVPA